MLKLLIRLLIRFVEIPPKLSTNFPFKYHVIFKGMSPFVMVHCTEAVSPGLIGSSPKLKGVI